MDSQTITYTNMKYNFTCIRDIKSLSEKDIIKFQKLFYTEQISEIDFNIIINIIKTLNC